MHIPSMHYPFHLLGVFCVYVYESVTSFIFFFFKTVLNCFKKPPGFNLLLQQVEHVGINSMGIVVLTGTFTGMVFALQSYIGFSRIGGEQFIGSITALAMVRELGPILTGLMVTGRASSAIAAELGTMRATEQIDALITLRINTFSYLIAPRMLAGILTLPCLTLFCGTCGIAGGYFVVTYMLGLSGEQYTTNITQYCQFSDVISGLFKSIFFGLILTWVGCYKGYHTNGSSKGVGNATTQAVVLSSILILITNFFLTKLLDYL